LSLPTALNQKDKLRIFGASSEWAIGNQGSTTFGRLNDTAITFNVPNNNSQGWWWGDSGHSSAQGAMALTSNGNLTVANSLRLGYGESDTNDTVDYGLDHNGTVRLAGIPSGTIVDSLGLDSNNQVVKGASPVETITSSNIGTSITPVQNTIYSYTFDKTINRAAPVGTIYSFEFSFEAVYQTAGLLGFQLRIEVLNLVTNVGVPIAPTAVAIPISYLAKVTCVRVSDKWQITVICTGGSHDVDARTRTFSTQSTVFTGSSAPTLGVRTSNTTVTSGDYILFHYINRLL
jgi:hypothetical protein